MNDKYFACTARGSHPQLNRPDKDEHVPHFGERRSPSCVEDWLEINDFDCTSAPIDDSPIKLKIPANVSKNSLTIETRSLQRENSFRSSGGSSGRTVKSIIESFSKSNQVDNEFTEVKRNVNNSLRLRVLFQQHDSQTLKTLTSNLVQDEPSKLSRSPIVTVPKKIPTIASDTNYNLLLPPRITSTVPKTLSSSTENLPVIAPSVLASLKPARRKKRPAPRAEDIYMNSKEKQQIMQHLSNIDIRCFDENFDVVIDSFSLEGEFV